MLEKRTGRSRVSCPFSIGYQTPRTLPPPSLIDKKVKHTCLHSCRTAEETQTVNSDQGVHFVMLHSVIHIKKDIIASIRKDKRKNGNTIQEFQIKN